MFYIVSQWKGGFVVWKKSSQMDNFEKDQTGGKNENYILLAIDVSMERKTCIWVLNR